MIVHLDTDAMQHKASSMGRACVSGAVGVMPRGGEVKAKAATWLATMKDGGS